MISVNKTIDAQVQALLSVICAARFHAHASLAGKERVTLSYTADAFFKINPGCPYRFLGMCNFLSRFMAKLSQIIEPLRCLLDKEEEFHWGEEEQHAFKMLKRSHL